jgi:hypothetical protein
VDPLLLHTSTPRASAVLPALLHGLARAGLWCSLTDVACGDDEDLRLLVEDRRTGTCLELLTPREPPAHPEGAECWSAVVVEGAGGRRVRVGPAAVAGAGELLAFVLEALAPVPRSRCPG